MTRPTLPARILLCVFILGAVLALAAPARAVAIEPVTSPGGITAWLVEDHSVPVVSLELAFRGGAALDPGDEGGLATLTASLLDEGAGDLDSSAYKGRLEDLATSLSFGAGEDTMGASLRTITANVAPAFDLLRLALTAPRFDQPAVARVKGQLLAALAHDRHEPRHISQRLWWETAFAGHPYARPVRGTPEGIERITAADLHGFVHRRFAKDVMLLAVVGDITPDALKPLLDKTFGGLPARAAKDTVPEVAAHGSDAVLLAKMTIPQSVVTFGQPGIQRVDPDWYAALIVNYILGGGGLTSRLAREVREERGLAYSVSTGLDPLQHSGVVIGGVATENAHVAQSIDIIRTEWKRMRDDGPTAQELADAKTYLTGSFPLSLDSTGRIARILVSIQRDHLGIDYLDRRKALIDGVTLDEAKRVARRLLDPKKLFFAVVGEPKSLPQARVVTPSGS
jgi:zinc protease